MTTPVATELKPDHLELEEWPIVDGDPADATRDQPVGDSFDLPTPGRQIGSEPFDDATQGRQNGSSPYHDAAQGRQIGSSPIDDATRTR